MRNAINKVELVKKANSIFKIAGYEIAGNGRIFCMCMGKRMYTTAEKLQSKIKEYSMDSNARNNAKKVCEYIVSNGGVVTYKSMKGSEYFEFKGKSIRVSDHHWTSEMHNEPELNLCSYDENGHLAIIEQLQNLN